MSVVPFKPVACKIPPVAGANGSNSKVSKVTMINRQALPPLQVKEQEKASLQGSFTGASRREMMQLTAASVGLLSLLLPESAQAHPRNASIRQKIMEKLEELGQMAGFSKPKHEGEEKKPKVEVEDKKAKLKEDPKEKKPNPKNGEENKPATTPKQSTVPPKEEPSVPALPNILNGKTVETSFP